MKLAAHPFLSRLGPDLLNPELGWHSLRQRMLEPGFVGRCLGALYLDQRFVAGVGNYLRSEILFAAACDPWSCPRDLSRGALSKLARATLTLGRRAYRTGGLTNPPARVAALRRQLRGSFAGHKEALREVIRFAVFARDGAPCYVCAEPIVKTVLGSRRLYYCPACQRVGPS